jgi:hypothetical protein
LDLIHDYRILDRERAKVWITLLANEEVDGVVVTRESLIFLEAKNDLVKTAGGKRKIKDGQA